MYCFAEYLRAACDFSYFTQKKINAASIHQDYCETISRNSQINRMMNHISIQQLMIQNSTTTPPNEDSFRKPIIQIMSQINQQQMRVRNPSQESRKAQIDNNQIKITNQKSPTVTQISVQIASDRISPNNHKDLLLINEEPNNKEDSQSLIKKSNDCELLYQKCNLNKSNKLHSSLKLLYLSRSNLFRQQILTKQQFKIIHDLSSAYIIPLKQQILNRLKQDSLAKQVIQSFYICFLIFYLTILLIELGCNQLKICNQQIFHYFLIIFQLLECTYQIIINKFCLWSMFADVITMLPFFAFLMDIGDAQKIFYMLYLIRIQKITDYVQNLILYINQSDQVFIIQTTIQLHFATFIAQTIIYIFAEQQQDYINYIQSIFAVLFQNPIIIKQYYFIVYLIRTLLLIFYLHKIRQIINYHSLSLDEQINYAPKTLKSIVNYQQDNGSNKFNMKSFPIHLQQQMKREKYFKILQNIPIFKKSFSHSTLLNLCEIIEEDILQPNKVIQQKQCLHFLLEGQIGIVQKCQTSQKEFKLAKIQNAFQIFNSIAFFKNQIQGIEFKSIGYSKIATLDSNQFQNLIRQFPREFQKYRMLIDTLMIENQSHLINIQCFSCFKEHDITECPIVNYKLNTAQVIHNYILNKDQNRIIDFKRQANTKKRRFLAQVQIDVKEDSESLNSEEYDKVESFQKVLPSSNSLQSQNNNNFMNQLEISSVPYINYSHSGQTLQSKKVDSEFFIQSQGVSSSISSRKIFVNEIKEIAQSKFQRLDQTEDHGSSMNNKALQRVQDSVLQTKKRFNKNALQKDEQQQQYQRYHTDVQSEIKNRDQRKNHTMVNSHVEVQDNLNRIISIENNFLEFFEKINSFEDYFPHYNLDQQINNYQKMQSFKKDSN
ncbi:unnamed protein product (macronuclear) [Paramecium tetraurelia]|uniref:Cyclic nucleotide-binding domain-containing protein n=1 Tax=Paramecium tetraurelia TaxID=5888 RepID=A0E3V0_PARTE|nr:uncharacterized protein GSPATT00023140001 [Paramecium tetraurelia]CAK89967.1 unnamed protein product [Paramecium tetraurelia]|eukprot:XP_001457364.1 hypothetical protein (macronuclear) [Paramecium tetraurelia strain d4-2]